MQPPPLEPRKAKVAAAVAASSVIPRKRKIGPGSCNSCRSTKRGCDGQFPCSTCLARDKVCSYSELHQRDATHGTGACDGCRRTKRACDGGSPCTTCLKLGRTCTNNLQHRRHSHPALNDVARANLIESSLSAFRICWEALFPLVGLISNHSRGSIYRVAMGAVMAQLARVSEDVTAHSKQLHESEVAANKIMQSDVRSESVNALVFLAWCMVNVDSKKSAELLTVAKSAIDGHAIQGSIPTSTISPAALATPSANSSSASASSASTVVSSSLPPSLSTRTSKISTPTSASASASRYFASPRLPPSRSSSSSSLCTPSANASSSSIASSSTATTVATTNFPAPMTSPFLYIPSLPSASFPLSSSSTSSVSTPLKIDLSTPSTIPTPSSCLSSLSSSAAAADWTNVTIPCTAALHLLQFFVDPSAVAPLTKGNTKTNNKDAEVEIIVQRITIGLNPLLSPFFRQVITHICKTISMFPGLKEVLYSKTDVLSEQEQILFFKKRRRAFPSNQQISQLQEHLQQIQTEYQKLNLDQPLLSLLRPFFALSSCIQSIAELVTLSLSSLSSSSLSPSQQNAAAISHITRCGWMDDDVEVITQGCLRNPIGVKAFSLGMMALTRAEMREQVIKQQVAVDIIRRLTPFAPSIAQLNDEEEEEDAEDAEEEDGKNESDDDEEANADNNNNNDYDSSDNEEEETTEPPKRKTPRIQPNNSHHNSDNSSHNEASTSSSNKRQRSSSSTTTTRTTTTTTTTTVVTIPLSSSSSSSTTSSASSTSTDQPQSSSTTHSNGGGYLLGTSDLDPFLSEVSVRGMSVTQQIVDIWSDLEDTTNHPTNSSALLNSSSEG